MPQASRYRDELTISDEVCVALYSSNMGEKQGLEIVLEVARQLQHEPDLLFVLCGEGAARERLMKLGAGLGNVRWLPLQPAERLNELLNLADVHLLPQRSDAADLVMPSKLTGMLLSGRVVLATAEAGTQVARMVSPCGKVVKPVMLRILHKRCCSLRAHRRSARQGAMACQAALQWEQENVLGDFKRKLKLLGGECRL